MQKLYYSIGEVAGILGESTSAVRFWSDKFSRFINPKRNAKGNRMFAESDIETLKQVCFLLKGRGMTIEGAIKELVDERRPVERRVKALESLKAIRAQLAEVRKSL